MDPERPRRARSRLDVLLLRAHLPLLALAALHLAPLDAALTRFAAPVLLLAAALHIPPSVRLLRAGRNPAIREEVSP